MARANSRPERAAAPTAASIVAGARALGLELTESQGTQLADFAALLVRWNAVHNLTAIDTPASILSHHLLDSLAILQPIVAFIGQRPLSVLDAGAGGGLPGIPLAVARPDWRVTLVDKVRKKVAFVTQVRLELALANVEPVHGRLEELTAGPFDLVVARAFGSLPDLVALTTHLLAPGGAWAAMKGLVPTAEIAALRTAHPGVRVVDIVKLGVPRLGAERHLLLLQRP